MAGMNGDRFNDRGKPDIARRPAARNHDLQLTDISRLTDAGHDRRDRHVSIYSCFRPAGEIRLVGGEN